MSHKVFREIPDEGSIDNMFDRLYNYINKVDEGWGKRVKPASKDKIDRLIMLSDIKKLHVSFPREYIKFLETMGDDDGGVLSSCIKSETKIDNLLEFYEWIDEDRKNGVEDEDYKERKFAFAYDDISEEVQMKIFEDGSHKILESFPEIYGVQYRYDSFEKMLFYSAFVKYEKRYFNYRNSFVYEVEGENSKLNHKKVLDKIEKEYLGKEYKKAWFSGYNQLVVFTKEISIKIDIVMRDLQTLLKNNMVIRSI